MTRLHKHIVDRYLNRPDAELDLHGLTIREAEKEFFDFIEKAEKQNWQKLRIIVGKGWNSPNGEAVLKDHIKSKVMELGYKVEKAKMNEGGEGVLIVGLY